MNNDFELFKSGIATVSNNKLCEIIVANRYLGIMPDEAIICMKELAERRTAGEVFQYEVYIQDLLNSLPKINLDLNSILRLPRIL